MKKFEQNGQWLKQCNKCNQIKDIGEFHKANTKSDGLGYSCKPCSSIKGREWYAQNKEARRKTIELWRNKNPEKLRKIQREWAKKQRIHNLQYKLKQNLCRRMREMIDENSKGGRSKELLGCTIEELKKYLESKFRPGMSWDNYGPDGWTMDHIIACYHFNLSKTEEQKKCFHYTNLQPLWATTKIAESYGDFDCVGNVNKRHFR